jgi:hypothetical protein
MCFALVPNLNCILDYATNPETICHKQRLLKQCRVHLNILVPQLKIAHKTFLLIESQVASFGGCVP